MKISDLLFEYFQHAVLAQQQKNRLSVFEMNDDGLCIDANWDEINELFQGFESWLDTRAKINITHTDEPKWY